MAFDYFNEEENKDKAGGGGQQGQTIGSTSPIVTGNSQEGQNGGTASGSFTNLNSYLDANAGRNFGSEVAGRVGSTIDEAKNVQGQAQQGFKSQADQNTVKEDQDLLGRVTSRPQDVAGSEQDYQGFTKMRDARYQGPNNLSDTSYYQPAYQATQKAVDTANVTKDEQGRKAYLQQQYGAGAGRYDYSGGQQKLDNLLIQNDPNSRAAFQDVQQKAKGAQDSFGSLQQQLNQYAQQASQQTQAARASARGAVGIDDAGNLQQGSQINQISSAAQKQADQLNQQKAAERDALVGKLYDRNFDAPTLAKTGLTAGTQLFGGGGSYQPSGTALLQTQEERDASRANLGQYVQTAPDLDKNRAASTEQQAKVAALSKLAGLDNTFLPYADMAGGYDPNKFNSFDLNRFNQANASNKAAYQDQVNPALAKISELGGRLADPSIFQGVKNGFVPEYQSNLDKVRQLQQTSGYEDVVGGGTPGGDWQSIAQYANAPVLPGTTQIATPQNSSEVIGMDGTVKKLPPGARSFA